MSHNKIDLLEGFLSNITIKEIDQVKSDIELTKKQTSIHYIVDTYDIVNYTLPFTDKKILKKIDSDDFKFKGIAYEAIFGKESKLKFVLLDEYKIELLSIKNNLKSKLQHFPEIKKKLLESVNSKTKKSEFADILKKDKYLRNNFDLFVFILIFIDKGKNIYDRFFEFIRDKIQIFDFESNNSITDKLINDIFNETRPGELSVNVFQKFINDNSQYLLGLNSDFQRYIYLENTYRDIAVIDRITNVNIHLEDNCKDENIIFYYLSSAPYKSKKIFEILDGENNYLPKINNSNFNFHRNIYQVFLYNFLTENNETDFDYCFNFLNSLASIKEQIKYIDRTNSEISKNFGDYFDIPIESKKIINNLNNLILESKMKLENSFYYKVFKAYKSKISDIIKDIESTVGNESLSNVMSDLANFFNEDQVLLKDSSLVSVTKLEKIRQTYLLSNKLKFISNESLKTNIPIGKDVIKNNFQHLPYLLFYSDNEDDLNNLLFELFNEITNSPLVINQTSNIFNSHLSKIVEYISNSQSSNLNSVAKEFLSLCFINIITPETNTFIDSSVTNILRKESEIITILIKQRQLISNSAIEPFINETNKKLEHSIKERSNNLILEIDYLLVWLYRRENKFDESIELANKYINKNKDPRFFHGRGLALCSKAYSLYFDDKNNKNTSNNAKIIKNLKNSILDLEKAVNEYMNYEKKSNEVLSSLLIKMIIAIKNNVIDSRLRIIEINKKIDKNILKICRKDLDLLKEYFNLLKPISKDYNEFPTINHTEAELEYYEALFHFNNDQFNKAKSKILQATYRCIFFEEKSTLVPEKFKSIASEINSLRYGIFDELNYFG